MEAADRKTVGDLLGQVVEIQDLRAIGELILQLVEGRLITNAYDYNYPIGAIEAMGDGRGCVAAAVQRLLDPQLSLDQVNLNHWRRNFGRRW